MIVAGLSIPESLNAEDLFEYLWQIINGFIVRGVKIASYAADGSTTERKCQRILESHATQTLVKPIKHEGERENIEIKIIIFGTRAIATIQDPKHLLKTFRNKIYSGARLLTFPT